MKLIVPIRYGAETVPLCRLSLIVSYPRVGLNLMPSQMRPSLFGCD